VTLTVSIGAALAHKDDATESLLRRADRLMYHSKIQGRNRVTADKQAFT
jgi:PleD family two-component response regulator